MALEKPGKLWEFFSTVATLLQAGCLSCHQANGIKALTGSVFSNICMPAHWLVCP